MNFTTSELYELRHQFKQSLSPLDLFLFDNGPEKCLSHKLYNFDKELIFDQFIELNFKFQQFCLNSKNIQYGDV